MDRERAERALAEFLAALGVPPGELDVPSSAQAIAEAYGSTLLAGYAEDPASHLRIEFDDGSEDLVAMCDIPFVSLCSHHLLPFHGVAHVAYLPSGKLTGFSSIARVVEGYARRLQSQERLARQIATALAERVDARGAACRIEATQLCVEARGATKPGVRIVAECLLGTLRDDPAEATRFRELLAARPREGAT